MIDAVLENGSSEVLVPAPLDSLASPPGVPLRAQSPGSRVAALVADQARVAQVQSAAAALQGQGESLELCGLRLLLTQAGVMIRPATCVQELVGELLRNRWQIVPAAWAAPRPGALYVRYTGALGEHAGLIGAVSAEGWFFGTEGQGRRARIEAGMADFYVFCPVCGGVSSR